MKGARAAYDPRAGRYVGGPGFGLPVPQPPAIGEAELELLVRFEHPAKLLAVAELPGAALLPGACQAAAYGTTAAELVRIRGRLVREVREAAHALASEPGMREAVERLPVRPGGRLVALGDSITDDLQSWAEIMRHCLERIRPGEITVVNAGVSGDTTADALARAYGIAELRPELVIAMLGTNDCQRHGPNAAQRIPAAQSAGNMDEIASWLVACGARVVWLPPPPLDEDALGRSVGARPLAVRAADVVALCEALRASGLEMLDATSGLGGTVAGGHLLADGLHPSLAGQLEIARAVLTGLARDG